MFRLLLDKLLSAFKNMAALDKPHADTLRYSSTTQRNWTARDRSLLSSVVGAHSPMTRLKSAIHLYNCLLNIRQTSFLNLSLFQAAEFVDIICINHYFAWYHDPGSLDVIATQTLYDLSQWHRTFNKSVILSGTCKE